MELIKNAHALYRDNGPLIPFVTFWKLIRFHVVTPGWPDDAAWLLAPWHTKSRPRMLAALKAAFQGLENYLAISTWILDDLQLNATRRSVNDSVHLVFDLEAGCSILKRFKFLDRKWAFHPWFLFTACSNSQRKTPQTHSNSPFWAAKGL